MGYLICENCKGYYKLQKNESPEDFSKCNCNGNLKYFHDIVDFIKENIILEQKLSELRLEIDNFKNEHSKLKTEYNEIKESYSVKKDEYKSLRDNYSHLYSTYNQLSLEKNELEEINSSIQRKSKDSDTNLRKTISDIKKDHSKLKSEHKSLKDNYSILKNEYGSLRSDYTELSQKNKVLEENSSNDSKLDEEYNHIKKINSSLEEKYSKLESEYEDLKSSYFNLKETKEKLSEENSKLKIDKEELKIKFENLEKFNSDKEALDVTKTRNNININVSNFETEGTTKITSGLEKQKNNIGITSPVSFETNPVDISNLNLKSLRKCNDCSRSLALSEFYKKNSSPDGYSEICKSCKKKRNLALGLPELLEFIEFDVPFSKDDLKERVDKNSFSKLENHIWELLELDLLDYREDSDEYLLRSTNKIKNFCSKYGILITPAKNSDKEKKNIIKNSKECVECRRVLSISKFYKTSSSSDGYSDVCKDCKRERNLALGLPKLLENIELNIPFKKEDLIDRVGKNNYSKFENHIWQLLELDFLNYRIDSDDYLLRPTKEFKDFCIKYGISID